MNDIAIFADRRRHLVTIPYTRDALLAAADYLDIPHHWLHRTDGHDHIDIPARRTLDVLADPRVHVVSSRSIVAITRRKDNDR